MPKFAIMGLAALMVTLLAGLIPALSQDMGGAGEEPEAADPMEAWMKLQQPGEHHKALAESAGEWTLEGKMWHMGKPGEKPLEAPITGKSTMKMLWGRYLQEEMSIDCPVMKLTMNMVGYLGYDNSAQEFQAMYIGDMGTGMRVMSGKFDEKAGTTTLSAAWVEKGLGGMKVQSRVVTKQISKDEAFMEIFDKYGDMDEFKIMEATYKRKK